MDKAKERPTTSRIARHAYALACNSKWANNLFDVQNAKPMESVRYFGNPLPDKHCIEATDTVVAANLAGSIPTNSISAGVAATLAAIAVVVPLVAVLSYRKLRDVRNSRKNAAAAQSVPQEEAVIIDDRL